MELYTRLGMFGHLKLGLAASGGWGSLETERLGMAVWQEVDYGS